MSEPRYYASPVDYVAWTKGYTPPSNHTLIHELSTGQAKVVFRASLGDEMAVAVVSINDGLAQESCDALEMMEFFIRRRRLAAARSPYPPKMTDGDL